MKVTVKIEGLNEVRDALEELPKAMSKNVMQRVLEKHAAPIAATAKSLAPVNTGELRDEIVASIKLTSHQRALHETQGDDVEVFVGSGVFYAHMQEFGTEHNPPHPFMRPAWDQHKQGVLDGLKTDLWAEIAKAVDKLARKAARGSEG